ncbi:restriction endonuclease subunit S [Aquimarina longa]|uniref:restriction endonuclease subunit S n=1 Tax=Aquimarina longa TaxID=1080221 RepID=UPI000784A52E|nr:restriction endonuclease subunit S [Aquimarina longa]
MEKLENKKPLVRFPEFKEDWEHKQLNELLSVSKTKNKDLKYGKDEVLSVSGDLGIVNQIEHLGRSYAGTSVHNYGVVELNQIVYTKSPLKANPYGIIKLNKHKAGIVSTLYAVYNVNKETDGQFIEYYFSLDANLNRYLRPLVRKGAKNDMKISNEYVLHDRIYAPQLKEQQKIAHFFSILDNKLTQLQEKKTALELYKKGMMQQIFSQQLRFKDDNGNDFPEWEVKKLGEVGKALIGLTYSPNDVVASDGTLVLRSSNVQDKRLAFEDNVYVKGEISEKNFVKENDILVCARNGSRSLIGKSALITKEYENCAFGAFMSIYRSDFNKFFFHVFQTEIFDKQITQHLGATINQITNKSLISFKFPIPCTKEQTKITNFLSKIDDKINTVTKKIEQTKEYKKGLLQKMFCN